MKYARLIAAFAAAALALCTLPSSAQQAPTVVSKTYSFVATGSAPTLTVTGASTCTIVVNGNGQGFAIVPEYSNDGGTTWLTANTVGSGNIQSIGTYSGVISSPSMTSFSFALPALATGSIYGTETCSFTQANGVVGGTGITVSGNAPAQTVALTTPVAIANGGTGANTLASSPFAVLNPASAQSGSININGNYSTGGGGFVSTATTAATFSSNATGATDGFIFNTVNATQPTGQLIRLQAGGASKFYIDTSGNVTASGNLNADFGVFSGTITAAQLVPNAAGYIIEGTSASVGRLLLGNGGSAYLDWNGTNYTLGNAGTLNFSQAIIQPGYTQHGIVNLTTPATCSAQTTCGTATVTFTTAMASAPECTATAATFAGYLYASTAATTTAVTFTYVTLAAVSSAEAVPVSYDCKV